MMLLPLAGVRAGNKDVVVFLAPDMPDAAVGVRCLCGCGTERWCWLSSQDSGLGTAAAVEGVIDAQLALERARTALDDALKRMSAADPVLALRVRKMVEDPEMAAHIQTRLREEMPDAEARGA